MEKSIQPVNTARLMPILHSEFYKTSKKTMGVTPEDKKQFLESFFICGSKTKAARSIGWAYTALNEQLKTDASFAADYETVRAAMKHELESTMYTNGLEARGYMDRITWLRKNYPEEYDPARQSDNSNNTTADAIKKLADSLKEYDLVPKRQILDISEG